MSLDQPDATGPRIALVHTMRAVAGVFHSRENAERGYAELRRAGYSPDDINFLAPGASEEEVHSVPVSTTEQPGVGKAIGGAVGGALGMAGGFQLGVGLTALVPGVGPVLAAGLAGMALLGAGGAIAGAKAGSKGDQDTTEGIPADEVFFYEDALRQGRSVIIVMANGASEAARAREILERPAPRASTPRVTRGGSDCATRRSSITRRWDTASSRIRRRIATVSNRR